MKVTALKRESLTSSFSLVCCRKVEGKGIKNSDSHFIDSFLWTKILEERYIDKLRKKPKQREFFLLLIWDSKSREPFRDLLP